ncbi:hypothetical protein RJ641_005600 [Dillenia turbinata]|uniref:C2H2-type domain-containing protein n=1 Tax=Dillenia turbinata TaxID=194707 RepID=A0AAN8V892_9MAGN
MGMKRTSNIVESQHFHAPMMMMTNDESWEEQAFAKDTVGSLLEGCVWPPRSYSCSFCRREFRSAQALGGHMNVHRRDRARLKQSLGTLCDHLHHSQTNLSRFLPVQNLSSKIIQNPSLDHQNLDSTTSSPSLDASTTLFPPRVSAISTQENISKHILPSPKSSTHVSSPSSKLDHVIFDWKIACSKEDDNVDTSLSMGLNTGISCPNRPIRSVDDVDRGTCKRLKIAVSSSPFSSIRYPFKSEDLDLELRLGDSPKVK